MNKGKNGEFSVTVSFNMLDIIVEILRTQGPRDALDIYQGVKAACDRKVEEEKAKVKAKLPVFAFPLFTESRAGGAFKTFSYDTVVTMLTDMERSGRVHKRTRDGRDPEYFITT